MRAARLAIMVGLKGRGSNMLALADACREGRINAEVAVVIGQSPSAPAIETAQDHGLPVAIVPSKADESSKADEYGARLLRVVEATNVDIICLAGYMRILPSEVVHAFDGRILNIHPALLPKFGGQGMFGMKVHEAVVAAGAEESGCTVHFVNERYDEGQILLQRRCPVLADDTPEALAARVLKEEHLAYPAAVELLWSKIEGSSA